MSSAAVVIGAVRVNIQTTYALAISLDQNRLLLEQPDQGLHCLPSVYVTFLGPGVIKLFSCSTQLSMIFFLLINVEMPTVVGISTFVGRKIAF